MIIEYDTKYDSDIKELLYQLQEYIMSLDKEGYNLISRKYQDDYFDKVMQEINTYHGKILLYQKGNKVIGLVVGCINNGEIDSYDFKSPKRGRISELVVDKKYRGQNIGKKLLIAMENYLKKLDCKAILISVFAYNQIARSFYEKNGYHTRMIEMIKMGN